MPLSRNTRMDRRKQLILESTERDPESAEAAIRARRRARRTGLERETEVPTKRDAGYSQDVRSTCQQRLVQLIPVRRRSMMVVAIVCFGMWATSLLLHYWVHIRPTDPTQLSPIAYLFHLRSYYGLPHWFATQLWMLTGIMAVMIYQIRKHKLDDYQARYRVWLGLAAASFFASMDSSTTCLDLLGRSIDPWARAEVGYSGMALVLATFAAIVGILGLRLCGELQAAPFAVGLWLGGLVSWGISALFGTGLLRTEWSQASMDLFVGGTWLGGILAVWLAAGIYLRHVYIHAHRRFLMRGNLVQPMAWSLPKMPAMPKLPSWKRNEGEVGEGEDSTTERKRKLPNVMGWMRRERVDSGDEVPVRQVVKKREEVKKREVVASEGTAEVETSKAKDRETSKAGLGSWFRKKSSDPVMESGTKVSATGTGTGMVKPVVARDVKLEGNETAERAKAKPVKESGEAKSSWFGFGKKRAEVAEGEATEKPVNKPKESNKPAAPIQVGRTKPVVKAGEGERAEGEVKKSWWPMRGKKEGDVAEKPVAVKGKASEKEVVAKREEGTGEKKRGLFGFMEGFKLKPPAEAGDGGVVKAKGPGGEVKAERPTSERPASIPLPSTRGYDEDDDEDDDQQDSRSMSKAERKKLRRDQQNQRRAA